MSVTPTFVGGGGSDYAEPTPWYKNKTLWIVGGGAVAILVFFYLSSQNSTTGTTAAVATPTAGGTTSANEAASIEQLQTTDAQILAALQNGQTGGQGSSGGSGASSGGSGGGSLVVGQTSYIVPAPPGFPTYPAYPTATSIGGPGSNLQLSNPAEPDLTSTTFNLPSTIDYQGTQTPISSLPSSNQTALQEATANANSLGMETTLINGIPQSYYQGVSTPTSGYYTGAGFGGSGTPVWHPGMRPGGV